MTGRSGGGGEMSVAVENEVSSSIERTLQREAWRNETSIATVRAFVLAIACAVEVYFATTPTDLDWRWRLITAAYFAFALGLVVLLRLKWYHPVLPLAIPFVDALMIALRMQPTFTYSSPELLRQMMELTTIMALATVLLLTGAFRLERRSLLVTSALAIAVFVRFALLCELPLAQLILHVSLLVAVAAMSNALTGSVRQAVRSEVARVTLSRFLPEKVLDEAHQDPVGLITQARSVDATVLVTDIRGFTAWAEKHKPIEVLAFLNRVQGNLAEIVRRHGGTVDKFMGDGMLAVFGAPEDLPNHAEEAIAAAREMLEGMARIHDETGGKIHIGIGVHSGELLIGCLGSGPRMEFTVLGDTVNIASRLETMTKELIVDLLVSAETVARAGNAGDLREVGVVRIRGREQPLDVLAPPRLALIA